MAVRVTLYIKRICLLLLFGVCLSACGGGSESTSENHAPVAQDVIEDTNEDETVFGQLVASDSDGDALSFQLVTTNTTPHIGTLNLTNTTTGEFNYVPNPSAFGEDVFTYRVNDGQSNSLDASLTIRINARPRARNRAIVTVANVTITGTAVFSDADSASLTVSIDAQAQNGVATITDDASGSYEYQPNGGYVGSDDFTFVVTDGSATSVPGTISIDVAQRPVIAFAVPASVGNESQTEQIVISIDPASPLDSSVSLTSGGTATVGVDYDAPAVQIDIPAGSTAIDLPLTVIVDGEFEIGETVELSLVAPCSACDISATEFNHVVTLDDWQGTVQHEFGDVDVLADDATSGPIIGSCGAGADSHCFPLAGVQNGTAAHVAKYDRRGILVWFTEIVPLLPAEFTHGSVHDIVVASDGSIFVVGPTGFHTPETPPSFFTNSVFVTKLGSDGVEQWSKIYSDAQINIAFKIALDAAGNIYVAGLISSALLVAKLDSLGTFVWSRQVDSLGRGSATGLAITNIGNIVVAGEIPASGVIILGFDQTGNELWRTFLDGPGRVVDAASVPSGGAVILGFTDGLQAGGIEGTFLAKVTDAGIIEWISQTGIDDSTHEDIVTDSAGNVFITGRVVVPGVSGDISAMRFDPAGALVWAQHFGGAGEDICCLATDDKGTGIGLDAEGNLYIGGRLDNQSVLVQLGNDGVVH